VGSMFDEDRNTLADERVPNRVYRMDLMSISSLSSTR